MRPSAKNTKFWKPENKKGNIIQKQERQNPCMKEILRPGNEADGRVGKDH